MHASYGGASVAVAHSRALGSAGLEAPPLMNGMTVRVVHFANATHGHHGEFCSAPHPRLGTLKLRQLTLQLTACNLFGMKPVQIRHRQQICSIDMAQGF